MKIEMVPQLTRPTMGVLIRFVLALLVFVAPALGLAHNSTKEVGAQIDTRERYVELADQVAPIFVLQDAETNSMRLDDFLSKVVILNFLYSRCEEQCPLHSL